MKRVFQGHNKSDGKTPGIHGNPRLNASGGLFHRLGEGHLPRQQDLAENHRKIIGKSTQFRIFLSHLPSGNLI